MTWSAQAVLSLAGAAGGWYRRGAVRLLRGTVVRLVLVSVLLPVWPPAVAAGGTPLAVPVIEQDPERCGPAALAMVLRFWGADARALAESAAAYDPLLHGSLITDLANAARRAGYGAEVTALPTDSLVALVRSGVPPIVLFQTGRWFTIPHYAVVTDYDDVHDRFTLHDGSASPRVIRRGDLERRWRTAGSQALIVRKLQP